MSTIAQMQQVMNVQRAQAAAGVQKQESIAEPSRNFADTIKDFVTAVNNSQQEAGQAVSDVVQGKSDNLAEAMTSLEESRLSFQLMLEVRNKLLESFQDLQRMQV